MGNRKFGAFVNLLLSTEELAWLMIRASFFCNCASAPLPCAYHSDPSTFTRLPLKHTVTVLK